MFLSRFLFVRASLYVVCTFAFKNNFRDRGHGTALLPSWEGARVSASQMFRIAIINLLCAAMPTSYSCRRLFARRRKCNIRIAFQQLHSIRPQRYTKTMSSCQDRDHQYDFFHSKWDTQAEPNVIRSGGISLLDSLGNFGQFNRSSIPLARQPSSSAVTVEQVLRIIAEADGESLLRSGNRAYTELLNEHNGTKAELDGVK